jgi:hypothetical protein
MAAPVFNQWLRKYKLQVSNPNGALDLSALRFRFKVNSSDLSSPNNAQITVTNLAPNTANQIQNEFTHVTLQAGYQNGAFGTIFDGDICQIHRGKENQTDTMMKIVAADGDAAHNFGFISKSLPAGSSGQDVVNAVLAALEPLGVVAGQILGLSPNRASRGKALYGMVRDVLDDLCATHGTTWSIQRGALTILPNGGAVSSQPPIVINANTGMVGIPTQTEGGVKVRCLIDPNIVVGSQIQLNNNDIVRTINENPLVGPSGGFTQGRNAASLTSSNFLTAKLPNLSSDGFYRVMAIEATGDTRGNDWYYDLVTLGTDASAPSAGGKFGDAAFSNPPQASGQ